ncbi:hypothetical protein A3A93_03885 [Candidatus Roizmanbacteria bacterium RIFCSPLOWO2_01_FULL_38_12]|uniref:Bacterial sugar transferase domain-containing protein n=1 Tax=Candidatus Roizmanbacteria bacterium RIFCSPLOWO2_01_FULL_38_12 TaxID=1802061 RepID=A0A1F7IYZ5_9BACT|nr:MAG: hypothetical protein A3A93_03885 [Candidatus Roizmanbacteria bacterium RIFCSPLOWO2_01_FULL_38_12]
MAYSFLHMIQRLLALVLLILNVPLLAVIFIFIKLTSKGPFLFKQSRVGKNKKPFTLYKIRTMVTDAEILKNKYRDRNQADGPVFKIFDDPRYTKIGKLLSHSGLDELPQLINIIKGEMAFVGPRPLPLNEARRIPKKYNDRFKILPGITSSWVVNGSHNLTFKEWMELDLKYIKNHNLLVDLNIAVKTLLIIMRGVSKYLLNFTLIIAFVFMYLNASQTFSYFYDEYEWVGRSYFFDLAINRDFDNKLFESVFSYDQPMLVYYIYGAVLYPGYIKEKKFKPNLTFEKYLHTYDLYQDISMKTLSLRRLGYNFDEINSIKKDSACDRLLCKSTILIDKARLINVFILAVATFIVFNLFQILLNNKILSIIGTLFWGTNFVIMRWSLQAQAEAIFLFLFNLGILFIFLIFYKNKKRPIYFLAFGLISALCFSTKIHGFLLVVFFTVIYVFDLYDKAGKKKLPKNILPELKQFLLVMFVFSITTLVLNPYLWKNPVQRLGNLYSYRYNRALTHQTYYPASALQDAPSRLNAAMQHLFLEKNDGDYSRNYHFGSIPAVIRVILFIIGLIFAIKASLKEKRVIYFFIITFISMIFIAFYLMLDWDRYYNILIFPLVVFFLYGIKGIYKLIVKLITPLQNR